MNSGSLYSLRQFLNSLPTNGAVAMGCATAKEINLNPSLTPNTEINSEDTQADPELELGHVSHSECWQ